MNSFCYQNTRVMLFGVIMCFCGMLCAVSVSAAESSALSKKVETVKTLQELDAQLADLLVAHEAANHFVEFFDFVNAIEKSGLFKDAALLPYYRARGRFQQLQFFEKHKLWEAYFNNKDAYEQEIQESIHTAKEMAADDTALMMRILLLEWQVARMQEKPNIHVLESLLATARQHSELKRDIASVKTVADELFSYDEVNFARALYEIYVHALAAESTDSVALKQLAEEFLDADKIDLAATVYDVYIGMLLASDTDAASKVKELFAIAEIFAHSGWRKAKDAPYAEKVYALITERFGEAVYDVFSLQRRAYNLERMKEYVRSAHYYSQLVSKYPKYEENDTIYCRLGILAAFALHDTEQAKLYFQKVIDDYDTSDEVAASLYYMGLLLQWQKEPDAARAFYTKLLTRYAAQNEYEQLVKLTKRRLHEIQEGDSFEYDIRMFLQATLASEAEQEHVFVSQVFAKQAKVGTKDPMIFFVHSYLTDTGCLQATYSYLWSGQLGGNQFPANANEFQTNYWYPGTKLVGVTLVDSVGVAAVSFEIVDVYKR